MFLLKPPYSSRSGRKCRPSAKALISNVFVPSASDFPALPVAKISVASASAAPLPLTNPFEALNTQASKISSPISGQRAVSGGVQTAPLDASCDLVECAFNKPGNKACPQGVCLNAATEKSISGPSRLLVQSNTNLFTAPNPSEIRVGDLQPRFDAFRQSANVPLESACASPHIATFQQPLFPVHGLSKPWSSLFSSMPRNAGVYTPIDFDIVEENGIKIPPQNVLQAGADFWHGYIVGFFLDPKQVILDVKNVLRRIWRLRSDIHIQFFDSMYYIKFSSDVERLRVLESEPSFIDGKPFILTPWSPSVASAREQVLSIPIWVYFSHIPSALQPLLGLNWLACNIGKLRCFDSNTVAREKLFYAKALIEITPDKPLPSTISAKLDEGHNAVIRVRYGWTPEICAKCRSFGHLSSSCKHVVSSKAAPPPPKIPLPRPPIRKWVPKVSSSATPTCAPSSTLLEPVVQLSPVEPVITVSDGIVTPRTPSATASSTIVASTTLVVVDTSSVGAVLPDASDVQPSVFWDAQEGCWIHALTAMRYDPIDETYFKFVTNDVQDFRCLYYSLSGDTLSLASEGKVAQRNAVMMADDTWDRSFVFSPESRDFDPLLAAHFRPFALLAGDVPLAIAEESDGGNSPYSDEE